MTAKLRLLSCKAMLMAKLPEDQLRMCFADARLTIRRDEIINFLDFVSDVPELTGNAHARTFMPPVILIGRILVRKIPEISASAHEHRGADQFAGADVAHSMAGHLQPNRHVDHRALVLRQQKSAQARRIVELLIALIIDPGCNPASTKSVQPEIFGQALAPIRSYPPPHA